MVEAPPPPPPPPPLSIIQLLCWTSLCSGCSSTAPPLPPVLTKHPSLKVGRKAFQQPPLPLSPWERGSRVWTWHSGWMGKWGGFFNRDAQDKGVQLACVGEQPAECVALRAKLLQWLHKGWHSESVERTGLNDFILHFQVHHMFLSRLKKVPLSPGEVFKEAFVLPGFT